MNPDPARQLEEFQQFSDMRLTPTHHWVILGQTTSHNLIRFVFIEAMYGIRQHRATKMGPKAAVAHFEKRLAAARAKIE